MTNRKLDAVKRRLIEAVREEGLPVALWHGVEAPGSMYLGGETPYGVYVWPDGEVVPADYTKQHETRLEDLSLSQLALLVEEGVRGEEAERVLNTLGERWALQLCKYGRIQSGRFVDRGPIPGSWSDPGSVGIRRVLEDWDAKHQNWTEAPEDPPEQDKPKKAKSPRRLP